MEELDNDNSQSMQSTCGKYRTGEKVRLRKLPLSLYVVVRSISMNDYYTHSIHLQISQTRCDDLLKYSIRYQ